MLYKKNIKHPSFRTQLNIFLLLLISIIFILALWVGVTRFDQISKNLSEIVLYEIRLPRLILSTLSGAMLALTGCVLQGIFRNPLASPDLLGSAAGATTSSIFLLYYGIGTTVTLLVSGVFSSLLCLFLIYLIAGKYGTNTLILAGVALNSLLGSVIALLLSNAKSPWALNELYLWLQGSFELADLKVIGLSFIFIVLGVFCIIKGRDLVDGLTLGEETAQTLGILVKKQMLINAIGCALIIGAIIPQTGIIGFIGLVAPHLARMLLKEKPSNLYLTSCLFGALLLLVADLIIWKVPFFSKVYVGTLTSFVGAPFLIIILLKQRRNRMV